MGFLDLSPASNHIRIVAPSLPPRLRSHTRKVFVPKTSSSHLTHSSFVILRNKPLSSTLFIKGKDQNFAQLGGSKFSIKVTTNQHGDVSQDKSLNGMKQINMMDLAVRFIRPYIFYGTLISYVAMIARVFMQNPHLTIASLLNWNLPFATLSILSALLCVDAYVMLLNQISDVEIDRINKPYLPLASGEISLQKTWTVVISCAIHSIATAAFFDRKSLLPFVLLLDLAIATIYSARPFYTKRSTFGAIITCASMRGAAYTLMHYAAASATLGVPFQLSPAVVFLAIFNTLVVGSISIMKDLPDLEGDRKCNVRTLALLIGADKASYIGFGLLFLAYAGAVAAAICLPGVFQSSIVIPAHLLVGCYVVVKVRRHLNKYKKSTVRISVVYSPLGIEVGEGKRQASKNLLRANN